MCPEWKDTKIISAYQIELWHITCPQALTTHNSTVRSPPFRHQHQHLRCRKPTQLSCAAPEHHLMREQQLELAGVVWDKEWGARVLGQHFKPTGCQEVGEVLSRPGCKQTEQQREEQA